MVVRFQPSLCFQDVASINEFADISAHTSVQQKLTAWVILLVLFNVKHVVIKDGQLSPFLAVLLKFCLLHDG
jgi:hypothetical protein